MTHIYNIENEVVNNNDVKSVFNQEDNTLVKLGYDPDVKLVSKDRNGLILLNSGRLLFKILMLILQFIGLLDGLNLVRVKLLLLVVSLFLQPRMLL